MVAGLQIGFLPRVKYGRRCMLLAELYFLLFDHGQILQYFSLELALRILLAVFMDSHSQL